MRDAGAKRRGRRGGPAAAALGLFLAACEPSGAPVAPNAAGANAGWVRPPSIQTATLTNGALAVSGLAQPSGRVVLRTASGSAYASATDAEGRFEILAPLSPGTVFFTPETQVGQDSAVSAERLVIIEGGRGPLALLRTGAATRRLDGRPVLGAIDTDGRVVLASGFALRPVRLTVGGESRMTTPDGNGQWAAIVEAGAQGAAIQVGEDTRIWPGAGAAVGSTDSPSVERVAGGWRIVWTPTPGVRQSTWLPDRP